jgi:hypothetical protein
LCHLGILLLRLRRDVRQTAIGPRYLPDQHLHLSWQSVRPTRQGDTQPITYLLADGGAATGVDLNVATDSWVGHENFRLAAVSTNKSGLKLRTIAMQAGGTEVGPGLACTATVDGMNDKPVALREGDRPLSLDCRSKSGKYEQRGCNEARNCDS